MKSTIKCPVPDCGAQIDIPLVASPDPITEDENGRLALMFDVDGRQIRDHFKTAHGYGEDAS